MRIRVDSINFGAKFLSSERVFKYNCRDNSYYPARVSFVEIEPCCDEATLSNIVKYWQNDTYACNILNTVKRINEDLENSNKYKIYALTSQKHDFKKLSSDKILALAQIELEENKTPYLSYLQVNPDNIKQYAFYNERSYKGVGTGVLNSLKNEVFLLEN